jgi:hypothetical protein
VARDLPLACSLDRAEMLHRRELLKGIATAGFIGAERTDAPSLELRFRASRQMRSSLERFVALEGECCPFLDFSLDEAVGVLTLSVDAPVTAAPVLDALQLALTEAPA